MGAKADELLQRLKATVGQEMVFTAPEELGRAAFRKYALAIQDPNPLYTDRQFARSMGLKDVMAPPTLICDTFQYYGADIDDNGYPEGFGQESLGTPWRAGNDYEFFQPIGPEDVITIHRVVRDVWQKMGRSGPMIFQRVEVSYHNQHGELLAKNSELLFFRPVQTHGGK